MGHSYNHGAVTSNKGMAIESIAVDFGASGAPTLVDKGGAGLIASVAKTSTGLYTFTMNAPFPPDRLIVSPTLDCVSGTGALQTARYVHGSYSASAGTFQIAITQDEDTPAVADPTSGTTLDVVMFFGRYASISV